MMKKIILMVTCFQVVTSLVKVYGQDDVDKLMPKTIMPSPNVAALGRYGSYEVSEFTGLPGISIPLYVVKSGSLSVPITLSYHASGNRYTDQSGWCGLGWTVIASGQIQRTVAGGNGDESFDGYTNTTTLLNANACDNFNYLRDALTGNNDLEPDIFSYSYPSGKSGKFMLSQGGQPPYLFPWEPIKLTPFITNYQLQKFEITDENGVLYRFGQDALGNDVTEWTSSTNGNTTTGYEFRTSWQMTDMIASNSNDKITFTYQDNGSTTTTDISQAVTVLDFCQIQAMYSCPPLTPTEVERNNYVTVGVQKMLRTILFEGGKVEFVLGADRTDQPSKVLDQINIFTEVNGEYAPYRSIKFIYSYFKGIGGLSNYNLRLKLDKVLFLDKTGNINQPVEQYKFTYHTDTFSWNGITNSHSRDYWGFYNGRNTGLDGHTGLVPVTAILDHHNNSMAPADTLIIGHSDRSVNPAYLTEGVLKRIDFPTSGFTTFEFEPHQYYENGSVQYAGGIRVSRISTYDGLGGPPMVKTYKYGNPYDGLESGYGIKNFDLSKFFFYSENHVSNLPRCDGCIDGVYQEYRSRIYLSNSGLSLEGGDGSPVLYPNVSEIYGDDTANIGKITYVFDGGYPQNDDFQFLLHTTRSYRNSAAWERGKLTKKTVYDRTGNKLTESTFSFSLFKYDNRVSGTLVGDGVQHIGDADPKANGGCQTETGAWVWGDEYITRLYSQTTGALTQIGETECNYQSGDVTRYIKTQSTLTLDADNLQVLTKQQTKSSTEDEVSVFMYPFSYGTIPSSATGNAKAIQSLQNKHVLTTPVETFHYLQNTDGSNQRVVSGQLTLFKENPANTNYVVPDEIDLFETSAPVALSSFTPSSVNSGVTGFNKDNHYQSRIKFTTYDKYGNLLDLAKTNDKSTAYIWGYNNKLPIAEVVNSDISRVNVTTPKTHFFNPAITSSMNTYLPSTTFTIDNTQTVSISIQVYKNTTGAPTGTPYVDLYLFNQDGGSVFSIQRYYITASPTVVPITLYPGDYTYHYRGNNDSNTGINLSVSTDYQAADPSCKVFHTSFEDDGTLNTEAHTGNNIWYGAYTFHLPSQNGSYILSYWQKSATPGGSWSYNEQTVTITGANAGANTTIGSSGNIIDDVRLYPSTALMTTYTYDPLLGITTTTDPSNVTTYYTYDSYGRLMSIKDDKQNILKNYQYQYNAAPVYTNPE